MKHYSFIKSLFFVIVNFLFCFGFRSLFIWKTELEERSQRHFSINWFVSQIATMAGAEPGCSQTLGAFSRSLTWTILCCSPRHIARELDWKWSRQILNWSPGGCPFGSRKLSVFTLQYWLWNHYYFFFLCFKAGFQACVVAMQIMPLYVTLSLQFVSWLPWL